MSTNSSIEWTDASWNPLAGCTPASEGCRNCYAAALAYRLERMGQEKYKGTARKTRSDGRAVFTGKINLDYDALQVPFGWRRPRRVFVNSMSDLFHEAVPDEFILEVWRVMERTPRHTYQVLTKRPARMAEWVSRRQRSNPHLCPAPNIWVGTSVEDQAAADTRILHLLRTPAAVRFLSCEPLIGSVILQGVAPYREHDMLWERKFLHGFSPVDNKRIHWVIVGGESGARHRPFNPDWARSLRDQCQAAGVAFFFKQHGGPTPKAGGRLLDGREWNEYPL